MKVDLTHFQAVRAAVDWNSKKAGQCNQAILEILETDCSHR